MALSVGIAIDDILQIRIFCYNESRAQLAVNVTHHIVEGLSAPPGPQTFDLGGLAAAVVAKVKTPYLAALPDACHFLGAEVQVVHPILSVYEGFGSPAAGTGSTEDPLPSQVAGLIRFNTALSGRSGRGRIYVPFPAKDFSSADGTPNTTYTAILEGIIAGYDDMDSLSDGNGASMDLEPVVFSRLLEAGNVIITKQAVGKWATQRRRGDFGTLNMIPSWCPLPLP